MRVNVEREPPVTGTTATQQAAPARTGSKVAVVRTSPETVLDDVARAMRLADYDRTLAKTAATLLKINISWQHYYPACSTTPWQLDGVIRALKDDGYGELIPAHNGTVVVDPHEGAANNRHTEVEKRHGLESVYLDYPPVEWVPYTPRARMLVLDGIFPEGIRIPEMFIGKNIVHLPTMKTHVFTTITGSMKNAFGGLLNRRRHWTHSVIHETLVDLLSIQKEIHPGIFTVTDGTFVGDGPGPRAMRWHVKNVLLAGADPVAVDAVQAKMMGFDPMSIGFIRLAHEMGWATGTSPGSRSWARTYPGSTGSSGAARTPSPAAGRSSSTGARSSRWSTPCSARPWPRGPSSPPTSTTTATGSAWSAAGASRPP